MRRADRRTFHFIYKTIHIPTGRYYVGMHSTDVVEDGYLGSGRWILNATRKHGKNEFRRDIVEFCASRAALREREAELVDDQLVKDQACMNLTVGGCGVPGMEGHKRTDESKKKTSAAITNLMKDPAERQRRAASLKGKKHTPERIANMVAGRKKAREMKNA